jgi:uncharacterized protein
MRLIDLVNKGITDSMRSHDRVRLGTLRLLKTAIVNREIELARELDEAESLQVVTTLVKQRRDSIEQFAKGGRADLAEHEAAEIGILEGFLPPPLEADELDRIVDAAIAEIGATSVKDLGRVMKVVMAGVAGRGVEGKRVNEVVRQKLLRSL